MPAARRSTTAMAPGTAAATTNTATTAAAASSSSSSSTTLLARMSASSGGSGIGPNYATASSTLAPPLRLARASASSATATTASTLAAPRASKPLPMAPLFGTGAASSSSTTTSTKGKENAPHAVNRQGSHAHEVHAHGTHALDTHGKAAAAASTAATANLPPKPPLPSTATATSTEKPRPPSPPLHITDKKHTVHFTRGKLLGEGGFARCYEVWEEESGARMAVKVIAKQTIKSQKAKQKLFTEIKIHQNLRHANIVSFQQVFEDSENVYMVMEVCENKTFVEMLKKRKRVTEPEARYFMKQLLDALQYMHGRRVIHRDLKLGNLFLTGDMQLRIGDFGLATVVREDGERKKTICGTPNYIAPEVLFDQKNGHSFEVDMWSLGVILYTLLIGRPPFQTKEVKAIYKKIKECSYEFPDTVPISPLAKELIQLLLTTRPELRPTIRETIEHPWFTRGGDTPRTLPVSALTTTPTLVKTTNILTPQRQPLGERMVANRILPESPTAKVNGPVLKTKMAVVGQSSKSVAASSSSKSVVAPSSASAYASSARDTPPRRHTATVGEKIPSPASQKWAPAAVEMNKATPPRSSISRQSASATTTPASAASHIPQQQHTDPTPPPKLAQASPHQQLADMINKVTMLSPATTSQQIALTPRSTVTAADGSDNAPTMPARRSMLETMYVNLDAGLRAFKEGQVHLVPVFKGDAKAMTPRVFISKWIDYSNKYGLGYQLTNGHVGVYFNDSSSVILSADERHFEYLEYARGSEKTVMNRHGYKLDQFPSTIQKKVTLLKHFKGYMRDNLSQSEEYNFVDTQRVSNMDFLVKYLRSKHAVLFRLTNRVVQINFFDHTKLLLAADAEVVTYINRDRVMVTHTLQALLARNETDIISRLKYAREILAKLTGVVGSGGVSDTAAGPSGSSLATAGPSPRR